MTAVPSRSFDAVLFDWCGTLVEYPLIEDRFRAVLERLDRPHDQGSIGELVAAFQDAERHPDALAASQRCDLSAEDHRETKLLICELAGIDHELAHALEDSYGDLDTYSTYPEVVDVITALRAGGLEVAIVSDFHVDLRPCFKALGLSGLISGYALSCEIGVTKPDLAMFTAALDMVDVSPERCLMVGDNPTPDTGGAALGISTLILPLLRHRRPPLLRRVAALALSEA